MIRKLPQQNLWRIYSKDSHKNLGTFQSLIKAQKHEQEINFFKHRK